MRKLILAAVFLFAVLFLVTRTADIAQVAETFQRGAPHWLVLAIVVHLVSILGNGAVLRALYRALGLKEGVVRLAMLWCSAAFFTTVTTSGGWGGMAVFVADGRKRGLPGARVTVASAMYYLYDFVTALLVVGIGLIVLIRRGQLDPGEVLASIVLAIYALILAAWLVLAWRSPERLGKVLTAGGSFINRLVRPIVRRDYLDLVRARTLAHEMGAGVKDLGQSPQGLILPIALSFAQKALTISILFLCFLAFSQPFSVGTLIAGYSLGILFTIVTPTPAGIGFVEGILTLAFTGFGIPVATSAVIALAYRGITLWLSLLYGMVAFRWVGLGPKPQELAVGTQQTRPIERTKPNQPG
jgi:uncharacterized protein (TIRG00374 family)